MSMLTRVSVLLICLALPTAARSQTVADSVADWSASGTQGENGWTNGYYDATADADGVYGTDDFTAFDGPDWVWNGSAWDWGNGDVPWTTIAVDSGHPNGDNNGDVHWAIRRWVSDYDGPAEITYNLAKQNVSCGNGTSALLLVDGTQIDSATVAFDDATGISNSVSATLASGSIVEVALNSLGTDDTYADGCDGSFFGMSVSAVPEPNSAVLLLMGIGFCWRRRR